MSSPIYRSIWWPEVHQILSWTPTGFDKLASSPNFIDVKDNMKRVRVLHNGKHSYIPSKAYNRKIAKMSEKGALPTFIQK